MADSDEVKWQRYEVTVPAGMGKVIDRALDEQVALENRVIDFSEFACWLLGLGLAARAQLVKAHKKNEQRIIRPGE